MKKILGIILLLAVSFSMWGQELFLEKGANGKYGYVDKFGKVVIPYQYDYISKFSDDEYFSKDGFTLVKLNDKYGLVNKIGKEVIPCKYDYISEFSDDEFFSQEGFVRVKLNDKYGLVDKFGKVVIPCKYGYIPEFSEDGFVTVQLNGKYGLVDKIGKEVIPCKYDYIPKFSKDEYFSQDGFVRVRLNGKYGVVDKTGKEVIPCKYGLIFPCCGDEFFSKDGFILVQLNGKSGLVDKFDKVVIPYQYDDISACSDEYFSQDGFVRVTLNYKYGVVDKTGKEVIPCKYDRISKFSKNEYFNQEGLASVELNGEKGYIDKNNNWYNTKEEGLLALSGSQSKNSKAQLADVDLNIPKGNTPNEKTFAVIIANENYQQESKVEYAQNDGAIFRQYCLKTLGMPEKNVRYVANATLNNIRNEVSWLTQVANAYKGDAQLIFYYAGHGVPDEASKSAYLLPIDGNGGNVETGYKLSQLYKKLGEVPSTSTLVFLDACFSGAQRSGDMMASARAVAIEAKPEAPAGGNMVIFSAAQGIETAYPYKGKNHGMFTYFLLKKLQESKGNATLGELVNYVTEQVGRSSIVENGKSQTPTVIPSAAMQESWKNLRLNSY